jgi:hypothetical protein
VVLQPSLQQVLALSLEEEGRLLMPWAMTWAILTRNAEVVAGLVPLLVTIQPLKTLVSTAMILEETLRLYLEVVSMVLLA